MEIDDFAEIILNSQRLGTPNQNGKTGLNGFDMLYMIKIQFICHGLLGKCGLPVQRGTYRDPCRAFRITMFSSDISQRRPAELTSIGTIPSLVTGESGATRTAPSR